MPDLIRMSSFDHGRANIRYVQSHLLYGCIYGCGSEPPLLPDQFDPETLQVWLNQHPFSTFEPFVGMNDISFPFD